MRPPRILRLITRLNAGGRTRHSVWLAEGLRAGLGDDARRGPAGPGTTSSSSARLRANAPRARFVVVGGGGEVEALRRLAGSLGISADVVFAGTRIDLPQVYTALDAVALSSRNEGTPLSLLEAMAAGRPIVATDVGGVRDLLTREWRGGVFQRVFQDSEKPKGLLVPAGDAEGLARNLAALAETPALAAELRRGGPGIRLPVSHARAPGLRPRRALP